MSIISLALPAGSLQEQTIKTMRDAGLELGLPSRSYVLDSDDTTVQARLLRAQEIAAYVASGKFDVGITGFDWIVESGKKIIELADLAYAKRGSGQSKWVLAVPNSSDVSQTSQLEGKKVSTEGVNLTRAHFLRKGIRANIEFSWGATESKAPLLTDAIVDISETGSSLRANNLKVIDTLMTSTPRLITNETSFAEPEKQERIKALAFALKSIISAREKWRLELNVPSNKVDQLLEVLPFMRAPDLVPTSEKDWTKITTIIDRRSYQQLLPKLKTLGAVSILAEEITRAVPDEEITPVMIDPEQILFGENQGVRIRNIKANQIDFNKDNGLIACIVQDFFDQRVLMTAFMNRDAFQASCETGLATFWSRTRNELWTKGSSSGNFLRIVEMQLDCDADAILLQCIASGPTCHNGTRSCFDAR